MFALRKHGSEQTSAETKPERTGASGSKQLPGQNPFWQSLALKPVAIQTKLSVSKPNDPFEHEADRVADQVMRMTIPPSSASEVPTWQSGTAKLPSAAVASGKVQRKCDHCEEEEETLHRKEQTGNADARLTAPPIVHEELDSPGQPLDPVVRSFMEPRLAHDLANVRVHTDTRAAESARAVNARAYTVGRHLFFDHGQYAPESQDGKRLLAHELTHVAQQSAAPQVDLRRQPSAPPPAGVAPGAARAFHPGVNHGHAPSGRWADIQANPASDFFESRACANSSPTTVVGIALWWKFGDKPLALEHLNWYLTTGGGADFVEDANLARLLRTDEGVQALVTRLIPATAPASGRFTAHVMVEQRHYQNQDFRFAFGAIDRLDIEVDFAAGIVHAWFQDRYEWHPVYPGLYTSLAGDAARGNNCVHAALVELKSGSARDFWMKGEATVPLSLFRPAPGGGGRRVL